MASARFALVPIAALLLLSPGCSLARSVLGATGTFDAGPGIDTGVGHGDTGVPDGGPTTCGTSCDDANPCTRDACDSTGTCTHTSVPGSCDDGVLCNGGDTCAGGTCSAHDGVDPCPGASHCDAATDSCVGCATSSDCPSSMPGDWGSCDFGSDLCTTTGTQTRAVTSYACSASGVCEPATTMESQSCTRASTEGRMCAAPAYGDWSACAFGTDPCTTAGVQTRVVTISQCAGGTCTPTPMDETQACTRMTEGLSCGMGTTSDWSACTVDTTCSGSGTQSRTTTSPMCQSGICNQNTRMEMQACTVSMGGACGATTCGAWGACVQTNANSCDRTGTQTRSCSTPTCSGSSGAMSCSGTATTTETQACSASVNGNACSTTSCGSCYEPGLIPQCRSGHTGSMRCSTTTGTCMDWGGGPFCAGVPSYSSRPCTCP